MSEFKYDKLEQNGFDVDLKQLSHDLAIIRISKNTELSAHHTRMNTTMLMLKRMEILGSASLIDAAATNNSKGRLS